MSIESQNILYVSEKNGINTREECSVKGKKKAWQAGKLGGKYQAV